MMAVSGIDHTIKIFSPDNRAQWEARNGINLDKSAAIRPASERPRLRRIGIRSRFGTAGDDEDNNEQAHVLVEARVSANDTPAAPATEAPEGSSSINYIADPDDDEADMADVPARNGGLAMRRRMDQLYQITSQNEQWRESRVHRATLSVSVSLNPSTPSPPSSPSPAPPPSPSPYPIPPSPSICTTWPALMRAANWASIPGYLEQPFSSL